jgi:hypothetical protein
VLVDAAGASGVAARMGVDGVDVAVETEGASADPAGVVSVARAVDAVSRSASAIEIRMVASHGPNRSKRDTRRNRHGNLTSCAAVQ